MCSESVLRIPTSPEIAIASSTADVDTIGSLDR